MHENMLVRVLWKCATNELRHVLIAFEHDTEFMQAMFHMASHFMVATSAWLPQNPMLNVD